jgi:hypothetical protein
MTSDVIFKYKGVHLPKSGAFDHTGTLAALKLNPQFTLIKWDPKRREWNFMAKRTFERSHSVIPPGHVRLEHGHIGGVATHTFPNGRTIAHNKKFFR